MSGCGPHTARRDTGRPAEGLTLEALQQHSLLKTAELPLLPLTPGGPGGREQREKEAAGGDLVSVS